MISDGAIEILGQKQAMLPISVISNLQSKNSFDVLNNHMKESMKCYAKRMGSSTGGMIKSVQDIYETTGLGKMEVIKLDVKKKETSLRLKNINLEDTTLLSGVLCGLFSFLFEKDLKKNNVKIGKKTGYFEVTIKSK